ncbi:MAG: hypothetical protein AAFQ68_14615 [Bacteroidota bacterium]
MIETVLPNFHEAQQSIFGESAVLSPLAPRLYLGDYGYWQENLFVCHGNLLADLAYTKTSRSRWVQRHPGRDNLLVSGTGTFIGEPCYGKGREGKQRLTLTAYLSRPGAFMLQHWGLKKETLRLDPRFVEHLCFLQEAQIWQDHFRLVSSRYIAERSILAYTHKGNVSLELWGEKKDPQQKVSEVPLSPSPSCFVQRRLDGLAILESYVPAVDTVIWQGQQSTPEHALAPSVETEAVWGVLSDDSKFVINNQKTKK